MNEKHDKAAGEKLERLKEKYGGEHECDIYDPRFQKVAQTVFKARGNRSTPYSGVPTFLTAPYAPLTFDSPIDPALQVAIVGVPMDLGVTNRSGARFGPRALRAIERIGPYNHVLDCHPVGELSVRDVGDVPFASRYDLTGCHQDIERYFKRIVAAGKHTLAVGGDHSITHPILRAIGQDRPVGMVHIDAHCDTGGTFDGTKFHHGGPFRQAVLDGVLDPARTIQIGIRGAAEYLWEFSIDAGMTVLHIEDVTRMGCAAVIEKALEVVGDGPCYVSFDVDGLDPTFAPGTGTPEIGGLSTREALEILRGLKGLNVIGGDVVEVAPQYDATTNTAQAGAQMLFEILSLMVFSPSIGRRTA